MVLIHQVNEPVEQGFAFFFRHTIDVLDVSAYWEYTFPSSDRVRADNWVNSLELASDILWGTAGFVIKLEASSFRRFDKARLSEGRCQCFQELLIWLADAIVDFVSGGP